MNIDNKLNSQEYKCELSKHLTSLLKRSKSAKTEAQTAFIFQSEIYNFIKNYFQIDTDFRNEESQTTLRHKFTGRMDAICNNLVIEYKRRGKLDKEKDQSSATEQISNYLNQLKVEDGNEYYGVLTDGVKIRYVYFQDGLLHSTPFKNIDELDLDKLIKSLVDINNKKFLPKNIVDDFKMESVTEVTKDLTKYLFTKINSNITGKASMLFQEWEVLFHLSETDKGQNDDIIKRRKALGALLDINIQDNETDYKALFALQTTYAIIVKLIACKVITKIEFNENIAYFSDLSNIDSETLRQFIGYIEDGYVFQTGGVRNLLEGDFFSWYSLEDIWTEEEANILIRIIHILEGYSSSFYTHGYTTIDIFIDLYMEIMPQEVRHSLGEYFTPPWLADYVVKESIKRSNNPNFTAIDPCCGSGVFIMSLIKQIIGSTDISVLSNPEKKELLDSILNRVKGIDINPLSVLTAKVCFYLSIKPLINNDDIEIPIYLGDSANIPTKIIVNKTECYQHIINTKQEDINIVLPSSFVERNDFFFLMSQIQSIIKAEDHNLVYEKFIENIDKSELNDEIINQIKILSEQLITLHQKDWDGIWIRIVANFMLVARIKNIDIIVGNPPWIKWEFLPQAYAEKIKGICSDRHLFSGQTYMGAISLNICALISNVTASTWLSENGVLAFLMPQTLMTQDSYAGFRNFFTNFETQERMYLQHLDDWTNSGNPFIDTTEKFMTYYYQNKSVDYFKNGIPITALKKKKNISIIEINSNQTFDMVKNFFDISSKVAYQMDKKRTGYTTLDETNLQDKDKFKIIIGECDYKARSGVEFTPAETYFIEPKEKVSSKKSFLFQPLKFKGSKYKNLTILPIQLETKYIRPVIKAPDIIPFGYRENDNYCIFPYDEGISKSVEVSQMLESSPNMFNYLSSNKKLIGKQSERSIMISRGKAFYSLSKVGEYTYSPHQVTFRDNTKLSAAVVQKVKTPWGEDLMPICAKHSPYISQDKNKRNITENEAYYLCGILNTPIVQNYFKLTYSTRSYSIDFNIKMPIFNINNLFHKNIMELARKATIDSPNELLLSELETNYLNLCVEIK